MVMLIVMSRDEVQTIFAYHAKHIRAETHQAIHVVHCPGTSSSMNASGCLMLSAGSGCFRAH
jgi:hypothetical protein